MNCDEKSILRALADIVAIDTTLDMDYIIQNILNITCDTINAQSGTVMLADETSGELRMAASYGLRQNFPEQVHEAPMKTGAEPIGVLNVYVPEHHRFTEEEKSFINITASRASYVVQEARLHTRLENNIRELDQTEKKYYDLFENANDAIYCYDSAGYFLDVNKASLELIGCTKEELIGTHISEWITPESVKTTQEDMEKRIRGEPVNESYVVDAIDKKGEHHYVEIRRRIIRQGDNIIVHGIGRDITEKMRLEKELEKSEAKYRELFENANDAIFTCSGEGHITTANNATVRMSGCNTIDEVIGTHFSDWFPPEGLKQALNNMRKYISGEHVKQPVIYEFIRKKGEHRWAEIRSRVIKEGDRAIALHCIARDITEKRKLEQELKESEARYRDFFENAIVPMYILDTKGNILKVNTAGLRLLSCTEKEVTGTNMSKWLTTGSLKKAQESQKKRFSGESVDHTDIVEFVDKNGEHRLAETKSRVIRDGKRIIGIHGIARDITENMKLKQELNKSDKQQKLMFYLLEGTRGGKTRALILKHLGDRSYNAHQLSKALNMDYKTVRHHLEVLVKNGIVMKGNEGNTALYSISKNVELNLNGFNRELWGAGKSF